MGKNRKRKYITIGRMLLLKEKTPEVTYYEIEIFLKNRGDEILHDYQIEEIIPKEFELVYDPLDNIAKNTIIEEGILRTWVIKELEKGEKINFKYEIKGATGIDYNFLKKKERSEN